MKLKFIFYLSICILTSCNAQQQDSKLISKTFPKYGITISLPQDWDYVDGSENMKNKLFKSFYREPDNNTPYNTVALSISFEVLKTQVPADSIFNQIKGILKNQVSNNDVTDYLGDKIQGRPTRIYKYNFSINEFQLTSISTFFIEQNILFCYNATVFTDKLESYDKILKSIAASIQIEKIDPSLFTDSYEFKKIESRYINKQYGFEIDFPIGWYYIEGIMGNAVQVNKDNQDTSETISMGVSIQEDYDSKMTSKQYNQYIVQVINKQMIVADSEEKINSSKFSHPSFKAYKAQFVAFVNNKKQIVFLYTTIKDKKGYLFVATTDEKHLVNNEKLFDKTFVSMTIK
jgi:hypothetical protein